MKEQKKDKSILENERKTIPKKGVNYETISNLLKA